MPIYVVCAHTDDCDKPIYAYFDESKANDEAEKLTRDCINKGMRTRYFVEPIELLDVTK
jgi:hypothetical protein